MHPTHQEEVRHRSIIAILMMFYDSFFSYKQHEMNTFSRSA